MEMNMEFCQSCAMPMTEEFYGTNSDESKNKDYCMYCYDKGEFTADITMEEMIEFCVPKMVENSEFNEKQAREMMNEMFPKLKRWKNNDNK
ncbi:zinc ribbon domain-containing protein [Methanobrevibacter sp. OttesenSCG-928-K11]|nr:zinc ribbon domain-containing protein [Methanobrevibacter sp. OttesenSCG-928-K11]